MGAEWSFSDGEGFSIRWVEGDPEAAVVTGLAPWSLSGVECVVARMPLVWSGRNLLSGGARLPDTLRWWRSLSSAGR